MTPIHTLDELDSLNQYGFRGARDMTRDFRILTINKESDGSETLALAAQLLGTTSLIVHFDPDTIAIEQVQHRASERGLSANIRFVSGTLIAFLGSLRAKSGRDDGFFDYVRFCRSATYTPDLPGLFALATRFLKDDGVLGLTTFGHYGREPYRQLQKLAQHLNFDQPHPTELLQRLKELFVFLPEYNWTRLAFDNLSREVRLVNDEAFARNFLREENSLTVPQLYALLDTYSLHHYGFARELRPYYNAWFLAPNLLGKYNALPPRQQHEFAEIGWSLIEEHNVWVGKKKFTPLDFSDPDFIPFLNEPVEKQFRWSQRLLDVPSDQKPVMNIKLGEGNTCSVEIPWDESLARFVQLVDGYKTLGEIALLIREETCDGVSLEEILQNIANFLQVTSLQDVFLVRHETCPILPSSAKKSRKIAAAQIA